MTPNNDDMKSETKIGGVLAPLTATGSPLEIKVVQNQPKIVSAFCIENCTFEDLRPNFRSIKGTFWSNFALFRSILDLFLVNF